MANLRLFGVGAGAPGEEQVHGVFRQDGDEGEDGEAERGGDVALGNLGGAAEEEGGGEDSEAEDRRLAQDGQVGGDDPDGDGGNAEGHRADDEQPRPEGGGVHARPFRGGLAAAVRPSTAWGRTERDRRYAAAGFILAAGVG